MKKRFARYSAVTAYVADGEDLAVHTSLERPAGPDRVGAGGGPLADAAHGHAPTVSPTSRRSRPGRRRAWPRAASMVAPVRTEAGLWAIARGLERLPRRVHAAGREAAREGGRRRSAKKTRRPPDRDAPCVR